MTNLLNKIILKVKESEEILFDFGPDAQKLVKLNYNERLAAVENTGEEKTYHFNLVVSYNNSNNSFSHSVPIIANSEEEAKEAAKNFFFATYVNTKYFADLSRSKQVKFELETLWTKEEADAYEEEVDSLCNFIEREV